MKYVKRPQLIKQCGCCNREFKTRISWQIYCSKECGVEYRNKLKRLKTRKHYQKNREKILNKHREYRQKNREKIRDIIRKHYQKNKEKILNKHREYRQKNREKIRDIIRKHYQKNKEKILNKHREYRQKNREKIRDETRDRSRKRYWLTKQSKGLQSIAHVISTVLTPGGFEMNALTASELSRIETMTEEECIKAFFDTVKRAANEFVRLAAYLNRLADLKGDKLEEAMRVAKLDAWIYIPLITKGKVSAMAVAAFMSRPKLLSIIAKMPFDEQEKYGLGEMVAVEFVNPLYGKTDEPQFITKNMLPIQLPEDSLCQVFDTEANMIRGQDGQRSYIKNNKKKEKVRTTHIPTIHVDHSNILILIDNKPIPPERLIDAILDLAAHHRNINKMLFEKRAKPRGSKPKPKNRAKKLTTSDV